MKQLIGGVALLMALLVAGLLAKGSLSAMHEPTTRALWQAQVQAGQNGWEQAEKEVTLAHRQWQRCRGFTAGLVDHGAVEGIDALFSQLRVYVREGETAAFTACCAQLRLQLKALSEAHSALWENFF